MLHVYTLGQSQLWNSPNHHLSACVFVVPVVRNGVRTEDSRRRAFGGSSAGLISRIKSAYTHMHTYLYVYI